MATEDWFFFYRKKEKKKKTTAVVDFQIQPTILYNVPYKLGTILIGK